VIVEQVANVGDLVRFRANADTTTDLWFRGWRITVFSNPSSRPQVEQGAPPPDSEPADPAKVQLWTDEDEAWLRFADWNMTFPPEGKPPKLQPVHPIPAGSDTKTHTYRVTKEQE
jgi:hypothetical protein